MPGDDLKEHATSSHDFYALLSITPETPTAEIRRAYRKTALKYHPDKHPDNPQAVETFHLLQIAYDVLTDPAVKALYDNARTARAAKARQSELFDAKRRQMKEDLERREKGAFGSGMKRKWEDEDPEVKLEREVRRLAEDGARRRKEREEMLRREQEGDGQPSPTEADMPVPQEGDVRGNIARGETNVPEIDRSVKIRWAREGPLGSTIDKDSLTEMFSKFGKIENAFLLKDKKIRIGDRREKKLMATGVVEYRSIVGAHAAVEDMKKQTGERWAIFESICWAANKEPDVIRLSSPPTESAETAKSRPTTPSTPAQNAKKRFQFPGLGSTPTTAPSKLSNGDGLKRVPSFASFSSVNLSTPLGSPFGKNLGAQSPSLEEITMIRLKIAEKKRLEEEIRRQDEEAAAAEKEQ